MPQAQCTLPLPREPPLRSTLRHANSICLALFCIASPLRAQRSGELARWKRHAQSVTIVRDDWGIAHVYGKTDADAVFGMEYAEAEDDFNRIETNYLNSLGRLAEAEGAGAIFQDLRQRLFIDLDSLRAEYRTSPPWLKRLMDAFADGLNYFLYKHPEVKPRVITHFEPWMALSFTEGSIGGDIERINLRDLAALYGDSAAAARTSGDADESEIDPSGSNGIAIAPRLTANNHALLWINPHTSFYFRSELQMVSDEGLNAYGAVTWGQFFIYQGFNATAGWMHTSSGVDNIDEFLESPPLRTRTITIPFQTDSGMSRKTFTVSYSQHGPVVRKEGDRLVSISLMSNHVSALMQSYTRTKAHDLAGFRQILELHTNSSNNTVFADAAGNIAYFHSNYIPRRDTLKAKLAEPIAALRGWDYRWGAESVPTSLAVFWGERVARRIGRDARTAGISVMQYVATSRASGADLLEPLAAAVDALTGDFGTWKTPWGEINRFQRINDDIAPHFDDAAPSIPVPFTAGVWGSLAAFGARAYPNTKKWYGTSGNSFVAVVEFGDSVRAQAVTAGGESGDQRSPHFNDEAERYGSGRLRDVYFYRSHLAGHTERRYHPGS